MRIKTCHTCLDNGPTVAYRPTLKALLCCACDIDARTSNVRRVAVPERELQDRYAQLAARYGF